VVLGDGAAIWHFCHVSAGATIGPRTTLGQNAFVGRGVCVGAGVKVQNNVSIYEGVAIEDDVFIGPSAVFTNVKTPRAFVDRRDAFEPTIVGRGASIGANAVIVCGHRIGSYALVGAGAVVVDDVADHAIVAGNPARRIGWASVHGDRLVEAGAGEWRCPATGERYRVSGETCERVSEARADIPFVDLVRVHAPIRAELARALDRVVSRGRFILGDEVRALEAEAAARIGVSFAIGMSSCTDALLASLMALEIGAGDEVVTSPFSFVATVECILRLGAKPVFADLEATSFHIDPTLVERAITPRTRAILAPHLFGAAFATPLSEIAEARGLPLVEDAAQAFGVRRGDRSCGALGAIGCFSFFPTKTLGALGDGGLVTTNDAKLAERLRALRSHGAVPDPASKYAHVELGGNFRLDELQAAFVRVKLARLDAAIDRRRQLAARYLERLAGVAPERLALPRLEPGDTAAYFVVRARERDALAAHLKHRGVATEVYYPRPLHLQPIVQKALARDALGAQGDTLGNKMDGNPSNGAEHLRGSFPRAEKACSEALALPLHDALNEAEIDRVAEAIREHVI
jgi:dTDP-4-amino-4,6-dideoxygalactose transaminase/acetyltransferase-like isoleucine patch superfamily enzyme